MAEELRLALILLGALAIGSVILHGIWTVRRTVNAERKAAKKEAEEQEPEVAPEEQEIQKLKLKQMEMDFATLSESKQQGQGIPVVDLDVDSIYRKENPDSASQATESFTEELDESRDTDDILASQQATPISHEKTNDSQQGMFIDDDLDLQDHMPTFSSREVDGDPLAVRLNAERDDEQLLDETQSFSTQQDERADNDLLETQTIATDDRSLESDDTSQSKPEPEKQEVLMLFVDKPEGLPIDGAKLLPTLLTLGFKFGDMDLFHRHQNSSGQGEILFSLANMFNPGTFDIDNMEQLSTRGLTIFMTLPNAAEPLQTFNMMHNAAKKIADEFSAKVLDDQRRPLDVAIVRSYVERIRKF
ncbi:MAG: cell division protein ZipA [Gammaproteobacteria bacterium]|nr:cell division protein ZipA [Gammaproteobacteria bacterium]